MVCELCAVNLLKDYLLLPLHKKHTTCYNQSERNPIRSGWFCAWPSSAGVQSSRLVKRLAESRPLVLFIFGWM